MAFREGMGKVGVVLALAAVMNLAGGHWAVLQMAAWAGMAVSYTQSDGLERGLKQTFSGEKPCHLCLKIEEGRAKEEQQAPARLVAAVKLEAVVGRLFELVARGPGETACWFPFVPVGDGVEAVGPEVPPPRGV